MSERIFIGSAKKVETQYGPIFKLGMQTEDLDKLRVNLDDRGWVNVMFTESKNGKWYACVDDYKPDQQRDQRPQSQPQSQEQRRYGPEDAPPPVDLRSDDDKDDIPF